MSSRSRSTLVGVALLAGCAALVCGADDPTPLRVSVDVARGELKVLHQGRNVMVYTFASNQFKPYVRELSSLQGMNVLRDAPADHLHHHGLMYAIRVNGVNFWEEHDQPGVQKSFGPPEYELRRDAQGLPQARLNHLLHWVASSNRWAVRAEPLALLVERRTLTLTVDAAAGEVALRWQGAFQAGPGAEKVTLHGSAYNGLGLRLRADFDHQATHINSAGAPYSAAQQWDVTAAQWSAVFHSPNGRPVMVALFGRASNRGQARFFTMLNDFTYLAATQNLEKEPLEYRRGEKFEIDYLVTVYDELRAPPRLQERDDRWEAQGGGP